MKDGFCESKNHLSCEIESPKKPQSASWYCVVGGAAVVSVSRGKDVLLMSGRIRRESRRSKRNKRQQENETPERREFGTLETHSTGEEIWRAGSCRVSGVEIGRAHV